MTPEQLKASILQYAMEGKLVKQDPNDEPASVLLEKIKAEKEKLVKEGKIKRSKKLPPIKKSEKPFKIPNSWEWVRLGEISIKLTDGTHNPPPNSYTGKQVISARNIKNNTIDFSLSNRYLTNEQFIKEDKRTHIRKNDVLLTIVGTLGSTAVVNTNKLFTCQRSIAVISSPISSLFMMFAIDSPFFQKNIFLNSKGTSQKGIYLKKLATLVCPLPPLNEQRRIVAKIEKLMPLVDKYAEAYNRLKAIDDSFDNKLKQSILQYAMEGKLVKQDPHDEPASVLLKKIDAEKEKLVKAGKIKKSKKLPPIKDSEKPFKIPASWEWGRLEDILDVRDGTHDTPKYVTQGVPLITSKNISKGYLDFSNVKYISEKDAEQINVRSKVSRNDIIFAMIGSIGNPIIVNSDRNFAIKNVALLKNFSKLLSIHFVFYCLLVIQNNWQKNAQGAVQKFISLKKIRNSIIPIPPLNEQQRIVTKIDELFGVIKDFN